MTDKQDIHSKRREALDKMTKEMIKAGVYDAEVQQVMFGVDEEKNVVYPVVCSNCGKQVEKALDHLYNDKESRECERHMSQETYEFKY